MKKLVCMILAILMIVSMVGVVSGQDELIWDDDDLPERADSEEVVLPDVVVTEGVPGVQIEIMPREPGVIKIITICEYKLEECPRPESLPADGAKLDLEWINLDKDKAEKDPPECKVDSDKEGQTVETPCPGLMIGMKAEFLRDLIEDIRVLDGKVTFAEIDRQWTAATGKTLRPTPTPIFPDDFGPTDLSRIDTGTRIISGEDEPARFSIGEVFKGIWRWISSLLRGEAPAAEDYSVDLKAMIGGMDIQLSAVVEEDIQEIFEWSEDNIPDDDARRNYNDGITNTFRNLNTPSQIQTAVNQIRTAQENNDPNIPSINQINTEIVQATAKAAIEFFNDPSNVATIPENTRTILTLTVVNQDGSPVAGQPGNIVLIDPYGIAAVKDLTIVTGQDGTVQTTFETFDFKGITDHAFVRIYANVGGIRSSEGEIAVVDTNAMDIVDAGLDQAGDFT